MSFIAYYLNPKGEVVKETSIKQLEKWCEGEEGLLWVDITGASTEDARLLQDTFNFHHLLVEDCMSTGLHSPKVDDFGNYLFTALGIALQPNNLLWCFIGVFLNFDELDSNLFVNGDIPLNHFVKFFSQVFFYSENNHEIHVLFSTHLNNFIPKF